MKKLSRVLALLFAFFLVSCQSYMVDTLFFDNQVTNNEALQRASQKDRDWYGELFKKGLLTNESIRSTDGFNLHALNVRAEKPVNIVVLSMHGFGNDAVYQFFKYGRMFYEQMEYNLFVPDLRNSGNSEGATTGWGWLDRKDILLWINHIIQIYGTDCQIVLHGLSMGAATVILTSAEKLLPQVKCGISDASYSSLEDLLNYQIDVVIKNPESRIAFMDVVREKFIADGGFDLRDVTVYEAVKKSSLPLLFIHSEFDSVSPIWMMYELYLAKPEPKEYWKVRFAKHAGIITEYPQEYAERTTQFIQKYTKNSKPLWR